MLQNEPLSISEEIKKEAEKLFKIVKESAGKDNVLIKLAQAFFNKKEEFDEWKEIDLIKSKEIFLELKNLYTKYFEDKNKLWTNLDPNKSEKISNMLKECSEYLDFLERELSIDESELIKAKFIQPITLSRIKKLKLELVEIENAPNSIEKEEKVFEIRGELKAAVDSIKKQTINLFNKSIDDKVEEGVLSRAKNYIDSNKFILAFLSLKNTTTKNNGLAPFMGLIPIGVIVILALILKKILKKKESEENNNKKIVLQEWEN